MTNVIHPPFKNNALQELALDILDCINETGSERNLSVPEVLGVLELVKIQIIDEAKEADYDE
jgi:hypothetical protein